VTAGVSKPIAATLAPRRTSLGRSALAFCLNNSLLIVLLLELAAFSLVLRDRFLSKEVLVLVVQNSAVVGVILPFYVACLIAGQIDLSVVNVGNLGALVFAMLMLPAFGLPLGAALTIALLFAVLMGLFNTWLILRVGVPGLVATLAVGTACAGLAYLITDNFGSNISQIKISAPMLRSLVVNGFLGTGLSMPVYLMLALYGLYYVLLNHTRLGAHMYAVGGNPQAAYLAGIKVLPITAFCLVGAALGTIVASIFLGARLLTTGAAVTFSAAAASTGSSGIPVPLVAAVISGIGLSGGTGRIERTLFGVLFFSVLTLGMGILSLAPQFRVIIEGAAIVLAIVLDSARQHLEGR